jgi:hypothetical protein
VRERERWEVRELRRELGEREHWERESIERKL